jgi:outer membrane lipoprotein-sorting protein
VHNAWRRPLPNPVTAIRDVFEIARPGTVKFVKDETIQGVRTRLFEAVPEVGVDLRRAAVPDRLRAWVGEDGLLRRQVLMKGDEVLMDARFRITDKNPRIRPGLFRFEPPPDYQVQDLTESTLRTLRSLESGQAGT